MEITLTVARDYDELSRITAARIIAHINDDPTGLYCFAGGDTPVATLRLLAKAAAAGVVDLTHAHFVELDEWVGIDERDPGSCISYLRSNLFEPAGIEESQIHRFNPVAEDLSAECAAADEYIAAHGGISLALLYLGLKDAAKAGGGAAGSGDPLGDILDDYE